SNSSDIIIGTPVAGRNRADLENLIGLFVNTLVLRNHVLEDITIKQFLYNVNQCLIEALNNQEIPFEKLIDELNIERNLSHTPLFQVMFVFNNSPLSELKISNLSVQARSIDLGTSKFDLDLVITKRNDKITGVLEYDVDLFKEETINLMIERYLTILSEIKNQRFIKLKHFNFIDDYEKIDLTQICAGKKKVYSNSETLVHLFNENLSENSSRNAVVYRDQKITYGELNKRANQLARYLVRIGVKNESIVAVCFERSLQSIISIIAIWKSSGVYLPLDPSYPKERLEYMLTNSKAEVILTEKIFGNFNENTINTIYLSDELDKISLESEDNIQTNIYAKNLAYIIYTSGSTGIPKGVMVQHQSALNLAFELNDKIYSAFKNKKLNISLNAPLPFDASMQQIIMLAFGHTLIIIPEEIRLDGNQFLSYINDKKIDLLDSVPTQLKILIEYGLCDQKFEYPKVILPGGEPIDQQTWEIIKRSTQYKFFNMYGPTECTVDSTICEISDEYEKPLIGKPVSNSLHYILDKNLNLCPKGIPGELYIGGEIIARGYLNNSSLTAERFIPNFFSPDAGGRIYKTGDLVRYFTDGNIEYIGRLDEQVKLRGFRIELGEIETILKNYKKIQDAAVIIREDEPNNKKLVAYYIIKGDDKVDIVEIKKLLSEKLPDYMIPNFYMELTSFPLLPNKKINRKAFPKPNFDRNVINSDFAEAINDNERTLLTIWKDILKIDNLGVNDNFFELGGDSILSIQVISKANQNGLSVSPKNLFQFPTIRGLASVAGFARKIVADQNILTDQANLNPIQTWFFKQDFINKITSMLRDREPYYSQADLIFDVDNSPIGKTVDRFAKIINRVICEKNKN
ncbi:MAG: amino acid adenylation domain-containing protein, partial [Ignavibacteriae bacterium]|nr:amino acid adenylation domain-containing protein [Ignavibacteriota bacterium]